MRKEIELSLAFTWECPICAHRYYTRGKVVDEATAQEINQQTGCQDGESWRMAPGEVTCVKCNVTFDCVDQEDDG
jgi:hypothetical protein